MKIDTQGMSLDTNTPSTTPLEEQQRNLPKAIITPKRLFTPAMVKELKILINEVLDERDGKTGVSYFDTHAFEHVIDEPEPDYEGLQ